MDRKVQAIEERMGANPHPENLKTVYCGAGDDEDDDDLILAHYDAKSDKFTPTLGFDDVSAIVAAEQPTSSSSIRSPTPSRDRKETSCSSAWAGSCASSRAGTTSP